MNPKKSRELIPEVAQEVGLPQNIVEAVVKMYWREVWESLTTLSAPKVHVENLGDFNVKHWLLEKEIGKCEGFEANTRLQGKSKYVSGVDIKDKIVLLKNIKAEIEEENQRKEFIYEHKKIAKQSNPDLEEQEADSTGTIL